MTGSSQHGMTLHASLVVSPSFCHVCCYCCSSKFIKEWVFDLCLELLYDPVPNVRLQVWRAASFLPAARASSNLQ